MSVASASVIVRYTCGFGTEHTIPGDDIRVLKVPDYGFVVACDCSSESLAEAHDPPHPTEGHLASIAGDAPTPEQWLALDDLSDGWYDTEPWIPLDEGKGKPFRRRQHCRDKISEDADHGVDETSEDIQARSVPCPNCGASEGSKCERPSGHTVRNSHADRVQAAREAGVLDDETEDTGNQARLDAGRWSA